MSIALQKLQGDWDFAHERTDYATHSMHPYPARMPPSLARRLISEYSQIGDLILDPFCGSGTVLVEASLTTRRSVGVDINPLAVLLSQGKTTPIAYDRLSSAISSVLRSIRSEEKLDAPRVDFENVDYWFKGQVQDRLARLRRIVDLVSDPDVKRFFQICVSVTVREVSNIRKGEFKPWRLSKKDLRAHRPDVYEIFSKTVFDRAGMIHEFCEMLPALRSPQSSVVFLGDARNLPLKEGCADLVVTSPPYGDSITTVAYGQFCKFSSLWVGLSSRLAMRLDQVSLGGRISSNTVQRVHSRTLCRTLGILEGIGSPRKASVSQFFADLLTSLTEIERCLKRGGLMCLVVGNRTVSRTQVPTDEILEELTCAAGRFDLEETFEREIPRKTLPWANAPENVASQKGTTISRESILVFSKHA